MSLRVFDYRTIPHADRNLYTIRPLPFTDVRSIKRHTPPLGWQYIIVVLSSGNNCICDNYVYSLVERMVYVLFYCYILISGYDLSTRYSSVYN